MVRVEGMGTYWFKPKRLFRVPTLEENIRRRIGAPPERRRHE
jgi:hypothetical protein